MKKIILLFSMLLCFVSISEGNDNRQLVSFVLNDYVTSEGLSKKDISVYLPWNADDYSDNMNIEFITTIPNTITSIILYIQPVIYMKDSIAIEVGCINNEYEKINTTYYLFKYSTHLKQWLFTNTTPEIPIENNDLLFNAVIDKLTKAIQTNTIFINTFNHVNLPSVVNEKNVINLYNTKGNKNMIDSIFLNNDVFTLNEILIIPKHNDIYILVSGKVITDYNETSNRFEFFIAEKISPYKEIVYKVKHNGGIRLKKIKCNYKKHKLWRWKNKRNK